MKKIGTLLLLVTICFFGSCTSDVEYLTYQNKPGEYSGVLKSGNNEYGITLILSEDDTKKIVFTSPLGMENIEYVYSDGNCNMVCGDNKFKSSEDNFARQVFSWFMLKQENMTSASLDIYNGKKVNILDFAMPEGAVITVLVSSETGNPVRMGTENLSFTINGN